MVKIFLLTCVLLGRLSFSRCYPSTVPLKSCLWMFPGHGFDSQLGLAPYTIKLDQTEYQPGTNVTVQIYSNTDLGFKGFFLQARKADCKVVGSMAPVGRFYIEDTDVTLKSCPGPGTYPDNAVCHNSNATRQSKTFKWVNPGGGHVYFKATFVQNFTTFWYAVKTKVLKDSTQDVKPDTVFEKCLSKIKLPMTTATPNSVAVHSVASISSETIFVLIMFIIFF